MHVLPHPGGGGETYVDALAQIDGYLFDRVFLAPSSKPSPAALLGGFRAQLTARRFDLLHVHGEIAASVSLPALGFRPSILTLHGLHVLRRLDGWPLRAAAVNLRLVVASARATICVAESEKVEVLAAVGPHVGRRVRVIHNGVEPQRLVTEDERASARKALGLAPHVTAGIFIGSLDARKDPLTAAKAAALVAREAPELVLLVAGDGPLRAELERLALETPAVRVLGFRDDIRILLAAADFFVLPSKREGLSFALLEAMSLGLAAVVSDAPGNLEAIGDAGVVVPGGEIDGCVRAFRRLLNVEERRRLGEASKRQIERQFTRERMLARTREVYESVLGGPGYSSRPVRRRWS